MKKNLRFLFLFGLFTTFHSFSGCTSVSPKNDTSQLKYTYTRLKVIDLDQMNDLMLSSAHDFKKSNDPKALQEGLLICMSRPDEDSVVEKVLGMVKTPLEDHGLWESSIEGLINEAVNVINDSNRSSVDQVTYSIVLENIISELRPEFIKQYKSPEFESRMIEKIATSSIELNAPARAERKLNLMKGNFSASQVAQKLLDKRDEALKAEKKKKSDNKEDLNY